jgi:hypothetical protein
MEQQILQKYFLFSARMFLHRKNHLTKISQKPAPSNNGYYFLRVWHRNILLVGLMHTTPVARTEIFITHFFYRNRAGIGSTTIC